MIYTLYLVNDNNEITETISLDVINNFGEDYSSSVAQNVVENGYAISDSVSLNNPKFSIGGVITDSKFRVKEQLVIFDGNTFVKAGTNRDNAQQIDDDAGAEIVRDRLFKLWENKEIFGILESKDINNIKGSQVRNIFPCILTNLSFSKGDTANAFYPTMSIEKIRYAVVTVSKVSNPIPELTSKYQDHVNAQSKTESGSGSATEDDKAILKDAQAQARAIIGDTGSETPKSPVERKYSLRVVVTTAKANAAEEAVKLGLTGKEADAYKRKRAVEIFDSIKADMGHPNAKFTDSK